MTQHQSGFHGFMKKNEVKGVSWKEIGVLTASRAPALAAACLGERFLCNFSKLLFCAAEEGV